MSAAKKCIATIDPFTITKELPGFARAFAFRVDVFFRV